MSEEAGEFGLCIPTTCILIYSKRSYPYPYVHIFIYTYPVNMGLCRYPYQVMEIHNTFATDGAKAEIDKVDSFFSLPLSRGSDWLNVPSLSAAYEYANPNSCRVKKVKLNSDFRPEKSNSFRQISIKVHYGNSETKLFRHIIIIIPTHLFCFYFQI